MHSSLTKREGKGGEGKEEWDGDWEEERCYHSCGSIAGQNVLGAMDIQDLPCVREIVGH